MNQLFDVWYRINREILFLTQKTFDKAPNCPGIYAWYYPLRIISNEIAEVLEEFQKVFAYDSGVEETAYSNSTFKFNWFSYESKLKFKPKEFLLTSCIKDDWNSIISDPKKLEEFKIALMKCSILMPPLYIGKTNNIKQRLCPFGKCA